VLAEINVSYAWARPRKKSTNYNRALSSDKYVDGFKDDQGTHAGHLGGMNVLKMDGSVRFVPTEDLPQDTLLPRGLTR